MFKKKKVKDYRTKKKQLPESKIIAELQSRYDSVRILLYFQKCLNFILPYKSCTRIYRLMKLK